MSNVSAVSDVAVPPAVPSVEQMSNALWSKSYPVLCTQRKGQPLVPLTGLVTRCDGLVFCKKKLSTNCTHVLTDDYLCEFIAVRNKMLCQVNPMLYCWHCNPCAAALQESMQHCGLAMCKTCLLGDIDRVLLHSDCAKM